MDNLESMVIRAQEGDRDAYDRVVGRFQEMALSCAFSILGDYDLAEDARQEALLTAYVDLLSLREPAAFPGWLRQIVRSHSLNLVRGRKSLTVPLDLVTEVPSGNLGPAQLAEREELRTRVRKAVHALPPRERQVITLFYLDDLSLKEVGEQVGIPQKTVLSRLHDARTRLRQRLMDLVKENVSAHRRTGDRTMTVSATREASALLEKELNALLGRLSDSADRHRACDLLLSLGRMFRFLGESERACNSFQTAKGLMADPGNGGAVAEADAEVGLTYVMSSQYRKAREVLDPLRARLQESEPVSRLTARVLNCLGYCDWGEGKHREAETLFRNSLDVCRRAKAPGIETDARNNLALIAWKNGNLAEALRLFRLCLKKREKHGSRFGQAITMMNIGIVLENMGRTRQARAEYGRALALAEEVGFAQVQAATYGNMANLALATGDFASARDNAQRSAEIARKIGDPRAEAIALENLAVASIGLEQWEASVQSVEAAQEIAVAIGDRERIFSLELARIELAARRPQTKGLLARLEKDGKELTKHRYESERPRFLRVKTQVLVALGKMAEAAVSFREGIAACERQKNSVERERLRAVFPEEKDERS